MIVERRGRRADGAPVSRSGSGVRSVPTIRFFSDTLEWSRRGLSLHKLTATLIALLPVSILVLELGSPRHCTTSEVISSILGHFWRSFFPQEATVCCGEILYTSSTPLLCCRVLGHLWPSPREGRDSLPRSVHSNAGKPGCSVGAEHPNSNLSSAATGGCAA
jgi:hypothetical protein